MSDAVTGFATLGASQTDADLMKFVARDVMNGMATATLVQVRAIDGDTVDVQPMVHQIDGANTAIPHGMIHGLPWFKLRAGAVEISVEPVVGDIGIAVFCHSDTSSVKATQAPAPPPTRRRFDWGDGFYFGGFFGSVATTFIRVSDGDIEIKAATIKLTGNVEMSGGTVTHDGVNVGKTHTHSGVTSGSGTSGPPA